MPALERSMSQYLLRSALLALVVASVLHGLPLRATYAAEEPDLIFKRSTEFSGSLRTTSSRRMAWTTRMLRVSHAISRFLSEVV